MKKRISTLAMAGVLALCLIGSVSAADHQPIGSVSTEKAVTVVAPRAEETEWYFRIFNGQNQKRLWSITYGKWLTDWINV